LFSLSPTQTYSYTFYEFKLTTDNSPFTFHFKQTYLSLSKDPLDDPLAAMKDAEPAPMQVIIARKRYRRDGTTAYEYVDGFG
jgi:hypothetical protein